MFSELTENINMCNKITSLKMGHIPIGGFCHVNSRDHMNFGSDFNVHNDISPVDALK